MPRAFVFICFLVSAVTAMNDTACGFLVESALQHDPNGMVCGNIIGDNQLQLKMGDFSSLCGTPCFDIFTGIFDSDAGVACADDPHQAMIMLVFQCSTSSTEPVKYCYESEAAFQHLSNIAPMPNAPTLEIDAFCTNFEDVVNNHGCCIGSLLQCGIIEKFQNDELCHFFALCPYVTIPESCTVTTDPVCGDMPMACSDTEAYTCGQSLIQHVTDVLNNTVYNVGGACTAEDFITFFKVSQQLAYDVASVSHGREFNSETTTHHLDKFCSSASSACLSVLSQSLTELYYSTSSDECSFIYFPYDAFDDQATDTQGNMDVPFLLLEDLTRLLTEVSCSKHSVGGDYCVNLGLQIYESEPTCSNLHSLGCCANALNCIGDEFNSGDLCAFDRDCNNNTNVYFPNDFTTCGGVNVEKYCNPICGAAPAPTPAFTVEVASATKTTINIHFTGVSCNSIGSNKITKFDLAISKAANAVLPGVVSSLTSQSFANASSTCDFSNPSSNPSGYINGNIYLYLNGYFTQTEIVALLNAGGFHGTKTSAFDTFGSTTNSNLAASGLPPVTVVVQSISTTAAANTPTPTPTPHATGAGNAVFAISSLVCIVSLLWHMLL